MKTLKNGSFAIAMLLSLSMALQPFAVRADAGNKPPVITHDPVTYGIKGQSLTLKAKVIDLAPGVQDVTLYYALFRDATPFRVPMKPAGLDLYVGTIDANMIKDVNTIAYYLEAQDKDGALAETPWYTVEFRKADETVVPGGTKVVPGESDGGSSWKTTALIAGGAAAVVVGAIALSGGGGGGGGGSSGTKTNAYAGTYSGTQTKCLNVSGQPSSCEDQKSFSIVIDSKGSVLSDTLLPGQQLTGNMSGNSFVLTGQIKNEGVVSNAVVNYNGTIVSDKIVGTISGGAQTTLGSGYYSGVFQANRQ